MEGNAASLFASTLERHRAKLATWLSVTAVVALLAGCGSPTATAPPSGTATPLGTPNAVSVAPTAPPDPPSPSPLAFDRNPAPFVEGTPYSQTIDPASFVEGVDNPFFPMIVGATFVFDGAEHIEVEVLPDRKMILGVAVTVVRDRVYEDGELIEDTLDW